MTSGANDMILEILDALDVDDASVDGGSSKYTDRVDRHTMGAARTKSLHSPPPYLQVPAEFGN